MPDEEADFTERARQLEEQEARAAQKRKHPNPLAEEGLRQEVKDADFAAAKSIQERGPSKVNPTADPDREAMLRSYHQLKAHHRDLRTGQLIEAIGHRVRFDMIRGPAVTGIVQGVDEEYGQVLVQGVSKSEGSIHILILKAVLHIEVMPEPGK